MLEKKKINIYKCNCGAKTITKDINKGVTPFMITCPKCNGDAVSSFYEVDQRLSPNLIWFKPSLRQLKKQVEWELRHMGAAGLIRSGQAFKLNLEHVEKGGLVLGPDVETIKKWDN